MRRVMGDRVVVKCDANDCKKLVRRKYTDMKTGKVLCFSCYRKTLHIINSDTSSYNTGAGKTTKKLLKSTKLVDSSFTRSGKQ